MKSLSIEKVNYGNHYIERAICDKIQKWNGCSVECFNNRLTIGHEQFILRPFEVDFITVTLQGQFSDGTPFRVVRPSERFVALTGDTITIASMHHDGYAVHFNMV